MFVLVSPPTFPVRAHLVLLVNKIFVMFVCDRATTSWRLEAGQACDGDRDEKSGRPTCCGLETQTQPISRILALQRKDRARYQSAVSLAQYRLQSPEPLLFLYTAIIIYTFVNRSISVATGKVATARKLELRYELSYWFLLWSRQVSESAQA
jgi:hypothetical protein